MKTYTFVSYDKYPKTVRKFHIFKKRFSSLSEIARFLKSSSKIYLHDPLNELSKEELRILALKIGAMRGSH